MKNKAARSNVFEDLADAIRDMARGEVKSGRKELERWKVATVDPISAVSIDQGIVADEEDDDFHVSQTVRDYDKRIGLEVGDILLISPHGDDEWTAIGVESDKDVD